MEQTIRHSRRRKLRLASATSAATTALALAAVLAGTASPAAAAPPTAPAHQLLAPSASVAVEGVLNFRDVGGPATAYGPRIRTGVVYRSGSLNSITDAGVATLARLGVTKVIDFRSAKELESGQDRLPAGASLASYPIVANSQVESMDMVLRLSAQEQQDLLGDGRARDMMIKSAREFVSVPEKRAQFAKALHDIALAPRGTAVVLHCSGGRDRTGWMAAIVQSILGASQNDVYAEYMRSNDELAAWKASVLRALQAAHMQDPHLVDAFLDVDAAYLQASFDEAVKEYGSFNAFVRYGLGLDHTTLVQLRSRLL
ncbi:tyrosine-protein phosphatase [Streptomyces sp. NPDC048416]|uniref:tyrosine-protein phosphatase n=1 Tax=Streptomyces sp. NPDC048416 TaxID=3365546 RepID=UPI0037239892